MAVRVLLFRSSDTRPFALDHQSGGRIASVGGPSISRILTIAGLSKTTQLQKVRCDKQWDDITAKSGIDDRGLTDRGYEGEREREMSERLREREREGRGRGGRERERERAKKRQ